MIARITTLLLVSVIGGLFWGIGTSLGLLFNAALRPAGLAVLVLLFWPKAKLRWKACIVFGAVLLSCLVASITYALQTDPRYILSDGETQLASVVLFLVQTGVAFAVLFILSAIRGRIMLNKGLEGTSQ